MNAAHIHLIVNHLPIVGLPLAGLVAVWGVLRRSRDIVRTGLGLIVILSVITYPVFLSGGRAEDSIEEAAWAVETLIERHEERAETTLIIVLVTGAIAAVALWQLRGDRPLKLVGAGIVLGAVLISSTMLGWTALDGGKIRHDEIRDGSPPIRETVETDDGAGHEEAEH